MADDFTERYASLLTGSYDCVDWIVLNAYLVLVAAAARWIYTACVCFGLDTGERQRSGFRYGFSVCQAEYTRNLPFRSGG